jgi:hypothetical protein
LLADSESEYNFSVVFIWHDERILQQRIYTLTHEQMGTFDLFIVPVAQNEEGSYYEAIFNSLPKDLDYDFM